MLQGIFSLDELMAREVMVPRTDAFMIDIEDDTQENIQAILKQSFSRIPVYEDNKDKIIGVIHTKNLLKAAYELGFENVNLRRIMNEPLFVPETIFVDDLLAAFRNTNNQMAILLDEYGGVAGLVTFEDLLEEIVGEIDDFNEHFGTELESDDVDTIAGYYLTGVGAIPTQEVKEHYEVINKDKRLEFINDKVKDGRVTKLKVIITAAPEEAGE